MHCVVTGAAGFIGSHLCERLLSDGHSVTGLDCFTDYYVRSRKEANLDRCRRHSRFRLRELDLAADPITDLRCDWLFHLAASPGLTRSWSHFADYNRNNVLATQRLLEALADCPPRRLLFASTSSVYGKRAVGTEQQPLQPRSPYGVTKLAAENLCHCYADRLGLSLTVLRYFSVYGPRQRPDMGFHLFTDALLRGRPITFTGGSQSRGPTFVTDAVAATVAAAERGRSGATYNVGGTESVTTAEVIRKLERLTGKQATVVTGPDRPGDQQATLADTAALTADTGWRPTTTLDCGLRQQAEWQRHFQ